MFRAQRVLPLLFLASFLSWGQMPTAEITGIVTDASAKSVVGANVTITNLATNAQRTLITNTAGLYDAVSLPPGVYSLRVEIPGFKTEVRNRLEVQVGQVARFDVTLQVGDVKETVQVEAQAATLDTETTTIGTVIDTKRIEDLPLNGRNYLQLASLVPSGTTYGPPNYIATARGGGDRANFQLNLSGQRFQYNHYSLDGVENTDPNYGSYLFQPSVDALQEFNVETSTYSAEYGHNMAQVNVITKSGTNQYHGTLFEFVRNTDFDANNFFQSPTVPVQVLKRNQFGGVIGGPVRIPKLYNGRDRLFFFFNYEGVRQTKGTLAYSSVPLPQYFTGDFSGYSTVIYDPATRVLTADGSKVASQSPFPGNAIPANRIAPASVIVARTFFPTPNTTPSGFLNGVYTNNFVNSENATATSDGELARIDWQQSPTSSFQFRYSHGGEPQYGPSSIPRMGTVNTTITHQSLLGNTWVISPTKVNDFKFGISRLEENNGNLHSNDPNFDYVKKLGIPYALDTPLFWGIPTVGISNFASIGDPSNGPYANWDTMIQFVDNFSWNRGKHAFKMGGEFIRTRFNLTGNDIARGSFSFTGQYTAISGTTPLPLNSVSDFLLGGMSSSQAQLGQVAAMLRGSAYAGYIQDQWKVSPKLTVNYGVRYELQPGYNEKYDHLVVVDFAWNNSYHPIWVRAGNGDFYQGNPGLPLPAGIPYARDGRFGNTTWKTDYRQWAPRFGLAYSINSKTVIRAGAGVFFPHDVGNAAFDILRNQPFTMRIQQSANSLIPNETWSNPFPILSISTLTPAWQWRDPQPYQPQWSFTIQRSLNKALSLEVAYVGSAGIHLQRTTYYNEPPPGPPTSNINGRRPFPDLGFIQDVESASHSSYHSLQARLQQRLAHGFTVLSSFSWEKSIDNGSGIRQAGGDAYVPQNVNDLRSERGLSAFNFGKRWTTSMLYQLPFGRSRAFLSNANRVVDAVLGGWQLGTILTLEGGFPFSVNCQSNGTYENTDSGCRADATGASPYLANPSPSSWFNTSAFVNRLNFTTGVGPYTFGNSGRNAVVGPGLVEMDGSLSKSFRFSERARMDFRAEFFNLPNHPNFGQPAATVGTATYGKINSTRVDNRQMQFGLKLAF